MNPRWIVHPEHSSQARERLCGALQLHPLVADILLRRGVDTVEEAREFLHPTLRGLHDPFLLKGMKEAAAKIVSALKEGRRIVVSGDYDVDGISSSALLIGFLTEAGAKDARYFIPNRFEHGYGLTPRTTDALLAMEPELVITVDNGITALEEVARLRAAGIETIVTDHHLPLSQGVPEGIVVNPVQEGCPYPDKRISGCGVAFKLITALRKILREEGWWNAQRREPNLKDCLDLVAIATVADIVPLLGENRVLVHYGLEVLNRPRRRPGLEALLNATGGREGAGQITEHTLGFQVGPRINAAGRMADGSLAVELLLARDAETAQPLAARLEEENGNRRKKGEEMFREALQSVETAREEDLPALVVASADFHEGIIGIVASRLVDRFHRPAMVLAEVLTEGGDSYKGSARSVPGIHVTRALSACEDLLEDYGGHAGAAGCRFPKKNLDEFRRRFLEGCARQADQAEPPAVYLESRLEPGEIDSQLVEQITGLGPFGQQNEEPCFLVEQSALGASPEVLKERHLKWRLAPGLEMLAWNQASEFESLGEAERNALQYRVRVGFNEYRGQRSVQLTVEGTQGGNPV